MSAWNKPRADMTPDEVRQARAYVRRRETEAQCRNCRHIKKSHGASGCVTQDGDECGCRTWYGAQSRADAGGADVSEKAQEMFEWLDRRFGNECGHNHARDNDKPPLPQGARPDTYKYLDAELSAAEERGRRRGVEERDELRMALAALAERAGGLLRLTKGEMEAVDRRAVLETVPQIGGGLLVRVLAPRDSAPCPDPRPGALGAAEASARRGGQLGCGNIATYRAPRDSGTSCGADDDGIHREARKDRK